MSEETQEGATSVVVECDFDEPPEKVWKALTTPEIVARWLMPGDMRPEEGHRFAFDADEEAGGIVECEVLVAEPNHLLRYAWRIDDGADRPLDSIVTFTLGKTAAGGTRLRVIHSGLIGAAATREFRTLMSAAGLPAAVEPQQPEPIRPSARPPTTSLYGPLRSAA